VGNTTIHTIDIIKAYGEDLRPSGSPFSINIFKDNFAAAFEALRNVNKFPERKCLNRVN
jgi:hypothetical protein